MKSCGKYVRKYLLLQNNEWKKTPNPWSDGKNGGNGRKYRWQYALCIDSQYRWIPQEEIFCSYEVLFRQGISAILAILVFFLFLQLGMIK